MGRKSALNEKQWSDIERRALNDEPVRALAREYGIAESAIRKRIGARTKTVKEVANQLVAAETAFAALPVGAQINARTLADRLKAISGHLAGAAEKSAATAHRLAGIANAQADKIDDADPMGADSVKAIKDIAALTEVANRAAEIPMGLLKANKEVVTDLNEREAERATAQQAAAVPNDAIEAAAAYAQLMRG